MAIRTIKLPGLDAIVTNTLKKLSGDGIGYVAIPDNDFVNVFDLF